MEIPKIEKIILHSSSAQMVSDKKYLSTASFATECISSQKPKSIFSKKPIAAFNLRKNQTIGITCSIRKVKNIFNFLEKLIFVVYPNYREFSGSTTIDGYGGWNNSFTNYSPFTETKSFYQFFDFLAGFNMNIKIVYGRSHLPPIRCSNPQKRFKNLEVWHSLFPLPQPR